MPVWWSAASCASGTVSSRPSTCPVLQPPARRHRRLRHQQQGQVVGAYTDAVGAQHGFVLDDGVFTTVDAPDAPGNTRGSPTSTIAAGSSASRPGHLRLLLENAGSSQPSTSLASSAQTTPSGINRQGDIVGYYDENQARSFHGFLRDKRGRYRRIDVPGEAGTAPTRINDDGQIVGFYDDTRHLRELHGFLLDERFDAHPRCSAPSRVTSPTASTTTAASSASTSTPEERATASCATATATSPPSTSRRRAHLRSPISTTAARWSAGASTAKAGSAASGGTSGCRHDDRRTRRGLHHAQRDQQRGQIAIDGFDRQSKHRSLVLDKGPHRAHSPRRADRLARQRHRRRGRVMASFSSDRPAGSRHPTAPPARLQGQSTPRDVPGSYDWPPRAAAAWRRRAGRRRVVRAFPGHCAPTKGRARIAATQATPPDDMRARRS